MNEIRKRAEQRYQILLSMLDHTGRNGLHYTADRDKLRVTVNMPAGLVRTQCRFYVHDDSDVITLHISTNVFADDPAAQIRVLKKMNGFNHQFIQGRFHLDPLDNEIMFSDGIRLAETMPSEEMLRGMMMAALSSVHHGIDDLVKEILASEPKEERKSGRGLEELIQQLLSDEDSDDEDSDDDLIESIADELVDDECEDDSEGESGDDSGDEAGEGEEVGDGADGPDEEE